MLQTIGDVLTSDEAAVRSQLCRAWSFNAVDKKSLITMMVKRSWDRSSLPRQTWTVMAVWTTRSLSTWSSGGSVLTFENTQGGSSGGQTWRHIDFSTSQVEAVYYIFNAPEYFLFLHLSQSFCRKFKIVCGFFCPVNPTFRKYLYFRVSGPPGGNAGVWKPTPERNISAHWQSYMAIYGNHMDKYSIGS